ncbi:MAG: hypothetical protein NVS2B14_09670 [Chamaesiphon sp.]
MYFYNAYGLVIQSALFLPELISIPETKSDVVIKLGKVARFPSEITMGRYQFYMNLEEVYFVWEQLGTFLVRDGKEIIVDLLPKVNEDLIHFPLLGMALAVGLHQRGLLVLHASTVAIDGVAVAFLGTGGKGKSTMAAALYARGHNLISDDLVAIDTSRASNPMVFPSFPQFKLWPEAAASVLGDDPDTLPCLASGYEKRARSAKEQFSQACFPLKRIYILAEGSTLEIKPVEPQESILHLISNSHIARIAQPLIQGAGACSHLRQCTSLLNNIPIAYLERPRSLPLLSEIAKLVEEELAHNLLLTMA